MVLQDLIPEIQTALTAQRKAVAKNRHHLPFPPKKNLPGKVVLRNFRDGLIQVAGLKWKHYSMSWHLSLEVGGWLGAQLGQPADTRLVLTSDTGPSIQLYSLLM